MTTQELVDKTAAKLNEAIEVNAADLVQLWTRIHSDLSWTLSQEKRAA